MQVKDYLHPDVLVHRDTILETVRKVAKRFRLDEEDREEFRSVVDLKLVSHAEQIFGSFKGRSSLETYLFSVISSVFWEWRNKRLGRWRPSVAATKLGTVAIELETLLMRDGYTFSQACQVLQINHGCDLPQAQLEKMAAAFPRRHRLQEIPSDGLDDATANGSNPEQELMAKDAESLSNQISKAMRECMAMLPAQDQLIVKLHFYKDVKLVQIAHSLGFPPKALYRRVTKIMKSLRKALILKGFDPKDKEEILASLRMSFATNGGETQRCLSNHHEAMKRRDHVT